MQYTAGTGVRGNLGLSVLPKDTSANRVGGTGMEPPTFWLKDDLLNHREPPKFGK